MRTGPLVCEKRSHASADRRVREEKARRIESLLTAWVGDLASKDVLEIGTGAGIIASHFGRLTRSLLSVDVVDERVVRGFEFRLVRSELLPCRPDSFDVVLSNHVIEHVDDQVAHLREIRRVLRPGGVCYLATPNRFAIMEPHFKLPFLSWLPAGARTRYVRLAGKGTHYDVRPLAYRQLRQLASSAGLDLQDVSTDVVAAMVYRGLRLRCAPVVRVMRPLFPSFVVLLHRSSHCHPSDRAVKDMADE